jgi:hypothetical protein
MREAWRQEAARLHLRYMVEVVEAYGLCPWAERARVTGRTSVSVLLPPGDARIATAVELLEQWGTQDAPEVGFLLYPRLPLSRTEFDAFVARIQAAASQRYPASPPPFALAAFHPDAPPNLETAERLVPFLRRSPDPCVQAVRTTVLDRVRGTSPQGTQFVDANAIAELLSRKSPSPASAEEVTLRDRIARTNLATVTTVGVAELGARIEAIVRDRAATYDALLQREGENA